MPAPSKNPYSTSTIDNMIKIQAIELAFADLNSQIHPNYTAQAEKYSIDRRTLARRHQGLTVSRGLSVSLHKKKLVDVRASWVYK